MLPYSPTFMRVQGLEKSTHVCPRTRHRTWTPQRCGAWRHRQVTVGEGFFDDTDIIGAAVARRQAAPLKSPATESTCSSSITARIVRSSFFTMPRFLALTLLMCNDITVNVVDRWEVVDAKRHVIARLVIPSLTLLQPPYLAIRA